MISEIDPLTELRFRVMKSLSSNLENHVAIRSSVLRTSLANLENIAHTVATSAPAATNAAITEAENLVEEAIARVDAIYAKLVGTTHTFVSAAAAQANTATTAAPAAPATTVTTAPSAAQAAPAVPGVVHQHAHGIGAGLSGILSAFPGFPQAQPAPTTPAVQPSTAPLAAALAASMAQQAPSTTAVPQPAAAVSAPTSAG